MTDNRRTSTRHTVSIASQLTIDGVKRDATMINLSLGGALVDSGMKHPMGSRMNISFRLPTMEEPVEIGATVRWSDAKGVGIQFDGLRARDVWALNEFFKQLSPS